MSMPNNPVTPGPVLLIPSSLSSCTNLTVDATLSTGSGGRDWASVEWRVEGYAGLTMSDENRMHPYNVLNILEGYGVHINTLITVPTWELEQATYTITLILTNFLGQRASTQASFVVTGNRNLPTLNIIGSSILTINPSQPLIVYSNAVLSSCSESKAISYAWTIFVAGGVDSGIRSVSNDPKNLIIGAYTLQAGTVYQAQVTALVKVRDTDNYATSLVTVQVVNGPVIAVVKGGYNRAVFITPTGTLQLDASISTDSNLKSTASQGLSFDWSCSIASTQNYGASCSSTFGTQSTHASSISLLGALVTYGVTYAFTVKVSVADGRTDSKTVTVQNLYLAQQTNTPVSQATTAPTSRLYVGAYTYISTSFSKFNADSQVSVFGYVKADYALTAEWTAEVSGTKTTFSSLTSQKRVFTESEAIAKISFPLAIPGNSFVPGSRVTFRIGADMQGGSFNKTLYSYSEIVLLVNAAPTGGLITSTPTSGVSLMTTFSLLSTGWSDEPSDYPLTFDYVYVLSTVNMVKTRSTSSSASASLPSGLEANSYRIPMYCRAYDNLLAASNTSISLAVVASVVSSSQLVNVSSYLTSGLSTATLSGDSSFAIQVVNNVANTLNVVNCTGFDATQCSLLNRGGCSDVPRTCSDCLSGYSGLVGASNTMCFNVTSVVNVVGQLGQTCNVSSDCFTGLCMDSICIEPSLQCPTSNSQVCSGNGYCKYVDSSGNVRVDCKISNSQCNARCVCTASGYGGADCSLPNDEVNSRDSARTAMCKAIITVANSSNPSTQLLETLVNTLLVTYSPTEVLSTEGIIACQDALTLISQFAASGLLKGSANSTSSFLVQTASNFVNQAQKNSSINGTDGSPVSNSVSNIIDGVLLNMVNGQDPIVIVSPNIRMKALRNAVSDLMLSSFEPPPTRTEDTYGKPLPSVSFSNLGIGACDAGRGYVQMSVMAWGSNPFPGATDVTTPLLRVDATTDASSRRRKLDSHTSRSRTETLNRDPAYYITLQFSTEQSFNFSLDPNKPVPYGSNATFPEYHQYNGQKYIPCAGCNISSYNNFNVTYGCGTIEELCSNTGSRRMLSLSPEDDHSVNHFQSMSVTDFHAYRQLQSSGAVGDDDTVAQESGVSTLSQFGAILNSVEAELEEVLTSFNPFAIDVTDAIPILCVVGGIMFLTLVGLVYFMRWDRIDHNSLIYAQGDKQQRLLQNARKLVDQYNHTESKETKRKMTAFISLKRKKSDVIDRDMFSINPVKARDSSVEHLQIETLRYDEHQDKEKYVTDKIDKFLDTVMPADHTMTQKDNKFQVAYALFCKHEYTSMFSTASVSETRTIRWMNLCMSLMLALMIDALFFGQFYTDDGTCEALTTEKECRSSFNKASNAHICKWDAYDEQTGNCTLVPPPEGVIYTMIVLAITVIIIVPIQFTFDIIRMEICAKRPDLASFKWDPTFWLFSESENVLEGQNAKESVLKELFKEIDKHREIAGQHARHKNQYQLRTVYHNTRSTVEEVEHIYDEVNAYISHYNNNIMVPWRATNDSNMTVIEATARAIRHQFGIDTAGNSVPLSLTQWLKYGGGKNRIKAKITCEAKCMKSKKRWSPWVRSMCLTKTLH